MKMKKCSLTEISCTKTKNKTNKNEHNLVKRRNK